MNSNLELTISTLLLTVPGALTMGCGASDPVASGNEGNPAVTVQPLADSTEPPPAELRSVKGVLFLQRRYVTNLPATLPKANFEDMSDLDLANALRPVTSFRDIDYVAAEPDLDFARHVKARILGKERTPSIASNQGAAPAIEQPGAVHPNAFLGSPHFTNEWPYRTAIAISHSSAFDGTGGSLDCTATMVGASSAVTTASCFHSGINGSFFPRKSWAPGANKNSGVTFPYGAWEGCYIVFVPNGWVTGPYQSEPQYDFATMEFNDANACHLSPGSTVGWLGSWVASNAQLTTGGFNVYGYSRNDQVGSLVWPSIYTGQGSIFLNVSGMPFSYVMINNAEETPGEEGAGVWRQMDVNFANGTGPAGDPNNDDYVIGIQNKTVVQSIPVVRRFDSTVASFFCATTNAC